MIVCFVAIAGSVFADTTAKQMIDRIIRVTKAADVIVIVDLSPKTTERIGRLKDGVMEWTDMPPPIREVRISTAEALQQFVDNLNLSEVRLRPGEEVETQHGKMIIYPPCQCLGEFRCRLFSNGKELLQFTTHHEGGLIRITSGATEHEFDLVPPFGSALHEQLKGAIQKVNPPPM